MKYDIKTDRYASGKLLSFSVRMHQKSFNGFHDGARCPVEFVIDKARVGQSENPTGPVFKTS